MEQFDWEPGGKELLLAIQLYIRENGGNLSLASKIIAEEREARNRKPDNLNLKPEGRRPYKQVRIWKGRSMKRFVNSDLAAEYVGTSRNNLQSCIRNRCRVKGWHVDYFHAKPRVQI